MAVATCLLALAIGWTFGGHYGLLWGAVAGWLLSAAACRSAYIVGRSSERELHAKLDGLWGAIESIEGRLPRSQRFYDAMIDGLPLQPYDLLVAHTPKTQEEWERVGPKIWPMIRRRMTECYGLSALAVDAARRDIEVRAACGYEIPRTSNELKACVEASREAERQAHEMVSNPHFAKPARSAPVRPRVGPVDGRMSFAAPVR